MENNNEIKIDVFLTNTTYKKQLAKSSQSAFESGYKRAIGAKVKELAKQKSDVELYKLYEVMGRIKTSNFAWICGFEGDVTKEQAMCENVLQKVIESDYKISDVYIFEMPKDIKLKGQRKSTHTFYGFVYYEILEVLVDQSIEYSEYCALLKAARDEEYERKKAAGLLGESMLMEYDFKTGEWTGGRW